MTQHFKYKLPYVMAEVWIPSYLSEHGGPPVIPVSQEGTG